MYVAGAVGTAGGGIVARQDVITERPPTSLVFYKDGACAPFNGKNLEAITIIRGGNRKPGIATTMDPFIFFAFFFFFFFIGTGWWLLYTAESSARVHSSDVYRSIKKTERRIRVSHYGTGTFV